MPRKITTERKIAPSKRKNGEMSKARHDQIRAKPINPKSQHKTPPRSKWSKANPHPDHIAEPSKYTIFGRPRCQDHRRDGGQCAQKAVDGSDKCVFHSEVPEINATRKRSHLFYESKDKIVRLVAEGYTVNAAAGKIGVYPTTVTTWQRKGREAIAKGDLDSEYAVFVADIEKNRVVACSNVENALYNAAISGNVSACIKYLSCRMPDVWNEKRVLEVQGDMTHDVNLRKDFSGMTTDQIKKSMANIAREIDASLEVGKE